MNKNFKIFWNYFLGGYYGLGNRDVEWRICNIYNQYITLSSLNITRTVIFDTFNNHFVIQHGIIIKHYYYSNVVSHYILSKCSSDVVLYAKCFCGYKNIDTYYDQLFCTP